MSDLLPHRQLVGSDGEALPLSDAPVVSGPSDMPIPATAWINFAPAPNGTVAVGFTFKEGMKPDDPVHKLVLTVKAHLDTVMRWEETGDPAP